jgi:regulatory protein
MVSCEAGYMPGRKPRQLDGPQLLDYAYRALSGRAQSAGELRRRLFTRAAAPSDVDEVMAKLQELGYLNDERFAEMYAAARRDNQGFGSQRVLRDLRTRSVAPKVAEGVVREAFADRDETAMIEEYLERRYRSVDLPRYLSEEKHLASAFRRLRLAGYSSGKVIAVLKRYAARADELEDAEAAPDDDAG